MSTEITGRPSRIRYQTLAWLTAAAALAYLCRNAIGVAESTIRRDLELTLSESGWFMGAFFWTYAVFQVPSGWLAERVGTRVSLSVFAVAWSLSTLMVGLAAGFWVLIAAQLLMGAGQAGIFPASCNSIGHWMPLARRSLACGILASGMQVGAIAASGLTGPLIGIHGWRWAFVVFSVPGIVWTIGFWSAFRDRPEQAAEPRGEGASAGQPNLAELRLIQAGRVDSSSTSRTDILPPPSMLVVLRRPIMWCLCGQQACRAAGYMFFASWFPTFLQQTRGVSVSESGYLQGLVLVGSLVGSLFGGVVTDTIWRRTGSVRLSRCGVGAVALGACAMLVLTAWFVRSPVLAVTSLALGALLAAVAGPCAFAATIDVGGVQVPQVFGLMNMSGNFAAAACPVLVGMLFEWTANWNLVLLLFVFVYLAGATCWILANPETAESG